MYGDCWWSFKFKTPWCGPVYRTLCLPPLWRRSTNQTHNPFHHQCIGCGGNIDEKNAGKTSADLTQRYCCSALWQTTKCVCFVHPAPIPTAERTFILAERDLIRPRSSKLRNFFEVIACHTKRGSLFYFSRLFPIFFWWRSIFSSKILTCLFSDLKQEIV